ncbi:hypothetical protein E9531_04270 [Lampropedia puyangensis]|uniref:Uncharacterized protein n=1 Tax=Lampropedia puyangensis TaxID=1330072 RepID=A0A4S8FFI8_9BURK|nr:hypothetical protein [Lampropedia puyangensis]THU04602.1 hypothetical protein E9531_04270 [Lampropedia puyangensis]
MAYLYDENGNYKGSITALPDIPQGRITILALLVGMGWFLWDTLPQWQTLPHPFKYIAAYYYYLVMKPLQWFGPIWSYASSLTGYKNLNYVLGGLAVTAYGLVGIPMLIGAFMAVLQLLRVQRYWRTILLLPAAIAASWFAFALTVNWLFQK